MEHRSLRNACIVATVLVLAFFTFWELRIRSTKVGISYDDGAELWSHYRAKVYLPADQATVFIGSSRNKYDLDIETWEKRTGEKAIQLAFEGTSPVPALHDLADDPNFKGKLMIDVTEGLVLSTSPYYSKAIDGAIAYYKKQTPAQKFSFQVNRVLESQFVFLERDYFSIKALLNKIPLKERPGIQHEPYFPIDFGRITFGRQDKMSDRFVQDTNIQNQVKGIWAFFTKMSSTEPPPPQKSIDSIFTQIATDVKKIKARGGQVLFVRTPSSGPFLAGEKMVFPRDKIWDHILQITEAPGIHFSDYPSLAGFQCLEFSHLTPADAITYTNNLIDIIEAGKWWQFPHKSAGK